jgi:putative transposon-encoded protein
MYEQLFGKVKTTHLNLLQIDDRSKSLTVINTTEFSDQFCHYVAMAVNDRFIIVVYRRWHRQFIVKVFDALALTIYNTRMLQDIEIDSIRADNGNDKFYIITDFTSHKRSTSLIMEYEATQIKKMRAFGQIKSEKSPFFVQDELVDIKYEKIVTKFNNSVRVASCATGILLYSFPLDYAVKSKVIVLRRDDNMQGEEADANKSEVFSVFNGYEKVSLYNWKGEVLVENKLRMDVHFDDFQLFKSSGRFAFVNSERNIMLID